MAHNKKSFFDTNAFDISNYHYRWKNKFGAYDMRVSCLAYTGFTAFGKDCAHMMNSLVLVVELFPIKRMVGCETMSADKRILVLSFNGVLVSCHGRDKLTACLVLVGYGTLAVLDVTHNVLLFLC